MVELPTLKEYEILAEIGRGGMGAVYKARQVRLDRMVALKVIRLSYLAGDDYEVLRRFEREARAVAALRHPNVVLIYDFDQHEDLYYITMELVNGQSLTQQVREEGPLAVEMACEYMRQTAMGLQHAFENGMVHRDIKPANLLVQKPFTALFPFGTIKILDMGLVYFPAKKDDSQLTVHGTVIGTPDYMSPEQTLDSHCVDIRSDLYSLGCTFYFLLAGKPPFGDFPLMKKLLHHQTQPHKSIHELRPDVPAPVAAVLDKLLAKQQEDRFQTPWEVAEALSQTMPADDSSIHSSPRPMSIFDTMGQLGDAGATFLSDGAKLAPSEAKEPPTAERFAVLKQHQGAVTALAFAPSRRVLASGGADGALRMWSLGSNPDDRVLESAHPAAISQLAFAGDSEMLASASGSHEGVIRLWMCHGTHAQAAGQVSLGATSVLALRFSPDMRMLAAGGSDTCIRIWDVRLASPKLLTTLEGHQTDITHLAFLPDGSLMASASKDGVVRVWDLTKFWSKEVAIFKGDWGQVGCLDVADGLVIVGGLDQKIHLCDLTESPERIRQTRTEHGSIIRLVNTDYKGETVLSACDQGQVRLWKLPTGKTLREWQLPPSSRTCLAATLDDRYLAAGNANGSISLFRLYPKR